MSTTNIIQNPFTPFVPAPPPASAPIQAPKPLVGVPAIPQPQPQTHTPMPQWQATPQMTGRVAQRRASRDTFLQNTTALVGRFAQDQQNKRIRQATVDMQRVDQAQAVLVDPSATPQQKQQAQTVINDVLGDPKKLRQIAKALNYDFLNPTKGSDNAFRAAINNVQTAKTQAQRQQLMQLLAQQAQAKFPQGSATPEQLEAAIKQRALQKLYGGQQLTPEEEELISPQTAVAQIKADSAAALEQQKAAAAVALQQVKDSDARDKDVTVANINANSRVQQAQIRAASYDDTALRKAQNAAQLALVRIAGLQQRQQISTEQTALIKTQLSAASAAMTGAYKRVQADSMLVTRLQNQFNEFARAHEATSTVKSGFSFFDATTNKNTYIDPAFAQQASDMMGTLNKAVAALNADTATASDAETSFSSYANGVAGIGADQAPNTPVSPAVNAFLQKHGGNPK